MNYIFLAEGFEEIEALTVVDVLRRANIAIETVSITDDVQVYGAHGIPVVADACISEIDISDSEILILPGGMPGAENLAACVTLQHMLLQHEGYLAAICAAPLVFGRLGLLEGVKATCYPGFEHELTGAQIDDHHRVTPCGRFITANGPGSALAFALNIVAELRGLVVADQIADGMLVK